MTFRKSNVYLNLVNSYLIDSPQPSSISYWWNLGSLLGLCLVIQICTGIFMAMHYSSNIELAFSSVEHIMRDVQNGWLIRYMHANGASFFFICMYIHIGKGLYYGSYRAPRTLVWIVGVIIFVATMAAAFLGYCCVYGQISHWGKIYIASNMFYVIIIIYIILLTPGEAEGFIPKASLGETIILMYNKYVIDIKVTKRSELNNYVGPLNIDIMSIIYGSLLGDGHAEKRKGGSGTRILFQQENINSAYLYYLHSLLANLGYCNTNLPTIKTRLGKNGKIRQYLRFGTWTYDSFNSIFTEWYVPKESGKGHIKIIPKSLELYLTPLALAIWIMDDGCKLNKGLKFSTNCFKYDEVLYLTELLYKKYNIKATIQKGNVDNTQFVIYVWTESIPLLAKIVSPYIIPSIKYKLGNYLS